MAFTENFRQIEFNPDKEIREIFRATQGDTKSQGFNVVVVLGGEKKVITTETMSFVAQKPDRTRVTDMAVKDGDGFKIELKNQVFAVPGVVVCTLVLRGANGEKLAGRQFKILVAGSMEDGTIISEDERGILDRALDLATDIVPRLEGLDVPLLENVEQEITLARGTEPTLGARLDGVITKTGKLKPKVVYPENLQDVVIGKNIFDKTRIIEGYHIRSATGEINEGESVTGMNAISSYIPVESDTDYIRSSTEVGVIFYDDDYNYLSGIVPGNTGFKTPINCKYIRLNLRESEKDFVQIEKGTIRTSYEDFYYTLNKFRIPNVVSQDFITFIPEVDGPKPVYYPDTQTFDFKSLGKAKIVYTGGFYNIPSGTTITNDVATSARLLIFNTDTKNIAFFPYDKTINNNEVVLFGIRHYNSPISKIYINSRFPVEVYGADTPTHKNDELPEYVTTDIINTQNKVSDLQTTNSISFAFITDTHADSSGDGSKYEQIKAHLRALKDMSNYGSIDFIALGGDITSGAETNKSTLKAKLSELSKILLPVEQPVYFLNGNHDDNSYYTTSPSIENTIRKLDWYNRVIRPFKNGEIHDTVIPESAYYYQDYVDKKVRVICLDACDYPIIDNGEGLLKWNGRNFWGYGTRQVNWLANEALADIPENYKIVVLSHMPTRHQYTNYPTSVGLIKNGLFIEGILTACHNGTSYVHATTGTDYDVSINVDFSTQGQRNILAYIHGHNHTSTVYQDLPFPLIGIPNSFSGQHSNATEVRVKGTDTEDCWDIVTIDVESGNINCTRYGAGDDRIV